MMFSKKMLLQSVSIAILMGASSLTYAASCSKGVCTVQKGDTLGKISQQVKVPWKTLMRINGITDVKRIVVGQKIKYVADKKASSGNSHKAQNDGAPWKGGPRESHQEAHYVLAGETLYAISRNTGVSVNKLIQLNDLQPPYHIMEGQLLAIADVMYN